MQDLVIAYCQYDIIWKNKEANFTLCETFLSSLEPTVDVVFLPEMFATGFCFDLDEVAENEQESISLDWMKRQASIYDVSIVGSVAICSENQYFNRLFWVNPSGIIHTYDKRHLFSLSEEPKAFAPGAKRVIIDYKGWRILPQVCYDLRFPVFSRNTDDYDLALYIANWPAKRIRHWDVLLKARAIENQSFVLGVNRIGKDGNNLVYNGHSVIISPSGELISSAHSSQGIITCRLFKRDRETAKKAMPFLGDRDSFSISMK